MAGATGSHWQLGRQLTFQLRASVTLNTILIKARGTTNAVQWVKSEKSQEKREERAPRQDEP